MYITIWALYVQSIQICCLFYITQKKNISKASRANTTTKVLNHFFPQGFTRREPKSLSDVYLSKFGPPWNI